MKASRLLLTSLVVLGITACASMSGGPAPTVDVTGRWSGQWAYTQATLGGGQISMNLKQTGAKVEGDMNVSGTPVPRTGPVSAVVEGNQLRVTYPSSITGSLTVQGDTMSGQIDGLNPATANLKRAK